MAITKLTPLPTPPSRADAPADFTTKADATLAAQKKMVEEQNGFIDQLNPLLPQIASVSENATKAQQAAQAAQTAQAATEAAAGNPIRLGLLQAIALCF